MNPFYRTAVKLALEHIDRNPDTFETKDEQLEMLGDLIEAHDLKVKEKSNGRLDLQTIDLTPVRYREIMSFIAKYHCNFQKAEVIGNTQLFMKGSEVVNLDVLKTIGFRGKSGADASQDGKEYDKEANDDRPETSRRKHQESNSARSTDSKTSPTRSLASAVSGRGTASRPQRTITNGKIVLEWHQDDEEAAVPADTKRKADEILESKAGKRPKRPVARSASELEDEAALLPNDATAVGPPSEGNPAIVASKKRKADDKVDSADRKRQKSALTTSQPELEVQTEAAPLTDDTMATRRTLDQRSNVVAGTKRKSEDTLDDDDRRKRSNINAAISESEVSDKTAPSPNINTTSGPSSLQILPFDINVLVNIEDKQISHDVDDIRAEMQSFACNVLTSAGVELDKWAQLVIDPSPELRRIYQTLFGEDWKAAEVRLKQHGAAPDASELIEACTGAAINELVWNRTLPWAEPSETMQTYKHEEEIINRALDVSGAGIRLRTLVWQIARNKVLDPEFQQSVIDPISADLGNTFMMTIEPLIRSLGAKNDKGYLEDSAKGMAELCTRALILKGLMAAAPAYYTVDWIKNGATVNKDMMEDASGSTGTHGVDEGTMDNADKDDRPRVVTWCATPLIKVRRTKEGPETVACTAKVFSRLRTP